MKPLRFLSASKRAQLPSAEQEICEICRSKCKARCQANKTPTTTVESFRVCLTEEGEVPIFDGPNYLGRGTWDKRKRRILGMPESVPMRLHRQLSQGLRLAATALKVKKEVKRRKNLLVHDRPWAMSLFKKFREAALPPNFTRWAQVDFRHPYVAVVLEERDVVLYRNWVEVGVGKWNPHLSCVQAYEGMPIPANVWSRIVQRLTHYEVSMLKRRKRVDADPE